VAEVLLVMAEAVERALELQVEMPLVLTLEEMVEQV
jgi:hypothetical protein